MEDDHRRDLLSVPARFTGPPGSANGGYLSGLLASRVGLDGEARAVEREVGGEELPEGCQFALAVQLEGTEAKARVGNASQVGSTNWCQAKPHSPSKGSTCCVPAARCSRPCTATGGLGAPSAEPASSRARKGARRPRTKCIPAV